MAVEQLRQPAQLSARSGVFLLILLAAALSAWQLQLDPRQLWPNAGGLRIAGEFFAAALSPAMSYETPNMPAEAPPFLGEVTWAAWRTVRFAAAAIGLSLLLGIPLGFLASTAWWSDESLSGSQSRLMRVVRRSIAPVLYAVARFVIAFLRSIHELLWAILFLAAVGLNDLTGVIAIAIPYAGTLAKIMSEMIDEAPRDAARAMRQAGAGPLQVFTFGLLPRALPDVTAYAFYRFECALRSSAILGFFGVATLGYRIRQSFEELYYREVWTCLYVLLAMVLLADAWSASMRRRFVG